MGSGTREIDKDLEFLFDTAMFELYRRAKLEAGYNAVRFFQMLEEHRGIKTARILLNAPYESEGYVALWERGRLDLTVEALVIKPEFRGLFTPEELGIARHRLAAYGFKFE